MTSHYSWAGIRRVCVAQTDAYVREYTPDEAREFAARLSHLADVADGKPGGNLSA